MEKTLNKLLQMIHNEKDMEKQEELYIIYTELKEIWFKDIMIKISNNDTPQCLWGVYHNER